MDPIAFDSIKEVLLYSGLLLESDVIKLFKTNGWSCISNRFYIDDQSNKSREIDLIAYKSKELVFFDKPYRITKAIIVSCKHTDSSEWVFCCEKATNELNVIQDNPLFYSDSKIFRKMYHNNKSRAKRKEWLGRNKLLYNAKPLIVNNFLEVKNNDGKWRRTKGSKDTNIHSAIDSLIKAVSFEIYRLDKQRKSPFRKMIYDFSLFSIFDGKMNIFDIETNDLDITYSNSFVYNNVHIIDNKQKAFSINFLTEKVLLDKMENVNNMFDLLVNNSKKFIEDSINKFIDKDKRTMDTYEVGMVMTELLYDWATTFDIQCKIQEYYEVLDSKVSIEYCNYTTDSGFFIDIVPGDIELYSPEVRDEIPNNNDLKHSISLYLEKCFSDINDLNTTITFTLVDLPF